MTERQRFITALEGRWSPGLVPTFELVFYLTMELIGKVHPSHRSYSQWDQMSGAEKGLQIRDVASTYVEVARRYGHSAIFIHGVRGMPDSVVRQAEAIREISGDELFLMCHGDSTMGIPDGESMAALSYRLVDEPEEVKQEQERSLASYLAFAEQHAGAGLLDGFALCADYCLNTNPFLSPSQFAEFVTPYLARLIAGYRSMGYYAIKHTDGNIMPILDQLVQARPHALHSIDPQAGVDIAEVKRRHGREICLIGNVNCGLLQTGTPEEVRGSVLHALRSGMPGGGYIFSTSNCVYTGMELARYDAMMELWRAHGRYA
jgi:uroporphyrinogen decarboxylase